MVDSIRPTYRTLPSQSAGNKVKKSSQVETYNDEKAGQPYAVTKDRRKKRDRRDPDRGRSRPVYDMRSGRGRRKGDAKPHFETKA